MPHNFTRPDLPYANKSLANDDRFRVITRALNSPITDIMLDSELNAITDNLNILDTDIAGIVAGALPGINDPNNANFVLSTDGAGHAPWKLIEDINVQVGSISGNKLIDSSVTAQQIQNGTITLLKMAPASVGTPNLLDGSVTTPKLANDAVTTAKILDANVTTGKLEDNAITAVKIADDAVTTAKLEDNAITAVKIADDAVTTAKLEDNAITAVKILDKNVTAAKIGSQAALANTFLAADGAGNASFIDKIGRILQIVNFEITDTAYDETPCSPANPISFPVPFRLNITPLKTGSKIIVFYSANISGGGASYYGVVLCRNNTIWKVGTAGGAGGFDGGVTNGGYVFDQSNSQYGTPCFSNVFVDTGTVGQQITYELKKALQYVTLNRSAYDRLHTISTMVAIEVDI